MAYLFLTIAVVTEVIGSSLLKFTQGFRRLVPTLFCLAAYGTAYYTISLALRTMPLNVAFATWCGAGTVITLCSGAILFHETITPKSIFGVFLLTVGILLLNLCN